MLSEKLYRLMLRVYPESHRREYGELMVQLFRDRMRYHGHGINRFVIWIQTILDLVPSAYREHRNELDTIADVLERGSEYLDGLGSPRTAIALLATFLLMNSSVLLSSEGGVLEELLVVNSSLIGVGLLMWFCERPKTQVFLRRADRPLRISVGILSLLLLGGYVWITLENRLYEDPFTYLFPVAILPIALGLTLWIGKIRNRLFNGLWPPVFACWGLIGATALGPVLLHSPDPTPWVEIWGGILVVGLGFRHGGFHLLWNGLRCLAKWGEGGRSYLAGIGYQDSWLRLPISTA